jgi:hypothetical protein
VKTGQAKVCEERKLGFKVSLCFLSGGQGTCPNTLVLRIQLEGVSECGYRILSGCEDAVEGVCGKTDTKANSGQRTTGQ